MDVSKEIKTRLRRLIYNRYYYWYVVRKQREKEQTSILLEKYEQKENKGEHDSFVLNIYDGGIKSGGLADRLRGIVSTYSVCKEKGLNYKLKFTDPFPLTDFLVPAKYDWTIPDEEISFDTDYTHIVVLDTTDESSYQKRKQERFLKNRLSKLSGQIHVYTNAGFAYEKRFNLLYNEMFTPSIRLRNAIDMMLNGLGTKYVSVSCRFLNLLGDFNEPYGYEKELDEEEKEALISKIEEIVEEIHEKWPGYKVLLNSDSKTFLNRFLAHTYIEINDGNITHIDNEKSCYSYERYEKTFLDLYGIANAEYIYLIKDKRMFKSGFPYMASKIGMKKFEIIEIE
ncbi:hypothetical protein [Butyrivibrio sp. INlla14]|uniref:hypothetical protein n=1 Tax=Butyrivibrio sp. INlla14 TaxID=1520808 RepID=UPI0008769EFB|nr:hypothetical protein [Butyrivibrio sp. INlla14]SCX84423.1 hypothetical protein SAMN02910371_00167 [Butyrivibrio sp. INlla14]